MFPNHQGKYDALGIMYGHPLPCSVVMDDARSHMPLVSQFIDLVKGKRIKLHDIRQAARIIHEVSQETAQGRKFIIFRQEAISTATVTTWIRLNRVRLRVP